MPLDELPMKEGDAESFRTGGMSTVALVTAAFIAAALLVDPRGEFPLNDDWSFALSTWASLEAGRFELAMFSGMALKTQIVWGALWTLLFGKSFWILRLSTMALSLLSLLLLDRWLAKLALPRRARALAVLTLLAHPIFFWSTFTYMTHVPFLFCSLAAIICAERAVSTDDRRLIWIATAMVVAAYALRQTGLALAVAFAISGFLCRKRSAQWRALGVAGVLATLLFGALYLGTDFLHGNRTQMEVHSWGNDLSGAIASLAFNATITPARALMNASLFTLPLIVPLVVRFDWRSPKHRLVLLALLPLTLAPASYLIGTMNAIPAPAHGDILENLALGPHTLRDTWIFRQRYPVHLAPAVRIAITYAAAVAAAAVLAIIMITLTLRKQSVTPRSWNAIVILVASAGSLAMFLVPGMIYFDRHSLDAFWTLIPLAALLVAWDRRTAASVSILLVAMLFFSVGATQEYFSWNRARWAAFERLQREGVGLDQLDGGYEINQYLIGGFDGPQTLGKAGMSVVDDEYILSFTRVKGYEPVFGISYRGYFGLQRGTVWALHRKTPFRFP